MQNFMRHCPSSYEENPRGQAYADRGRVQPPLGGQNSAAEKCHSGTSRGIRPEGVHRPSAGEAEGQQQRRGRRSSRAVILPIRPRLLSKNHLGFHRGPIGSSGTTVKVSGSTNYGLPHPSCCPLTGPRVLPPDRLIATLSQELPSSRREKHSYHLIPRKILEKKWQ